ncbi:MAG: phosphoribosylanthranilate isomerase [Cyclobacteriaceae bacterium]|nr:phosphoribosylanthranilate isomerase [Cyclobacteriaceae bacterium]
MIKLKICGFKDSSNMLEVGKLLPDYMGFIFYPPSPRYVGEDFQMPVGLNTAIHRVGVFVNEQVDRIIELSARHNLSHVQLHGDESVAVCEQLKQEGLRVIKVFRIGPDFDFSVALPYKEAVDYFLFDTKGKHYGGNAQVFDWSILEQYDQEIPFFLSGGLTVENIQDVKRLKNMNLHALDLNSGVEDSPGVKNVSLIKEVVSLVRT